MSFQANDGTVSGITPPPNFGVWGDTSEGDGVVGTSAGGSGVSAQSTTGFGLAGSSDSGWGVIASSRAGVGVLGISGSTERAGVGAISNGDGVVSIGGNLSGFFFGNVDVTGTLTKGTLAFRIDHPLDPANKYLFHSGVESPDMKNIYDGVVVLDANGEAAIDLPAWFEALNSEFRYQLTPIGAPGPNLYIAEEISNQRFRIAGGTPGMKISWQVTGIRQDAFAKANRIPVEQDKPTKERGYYAHPEVHGQPLEQSLLGARHPEELKRFLELQQKAP